MSLHPQPALAVPADTAALARRVFRHGNAYLRLRDTFGTIFRDAEFLALYAHAGHPACSPARLALVTLLQFIENLTDAQAADAVRARIDWKYLLGLPLADPGFDASVLSEFRRRLVVHGAEQRLLDALLETARAHDLLQPGGTVRTDATHVVAHLRHLNRVQLVQETMRHVLEVLATVAPTWIVAHSDPTWLERYELRTASWRLPPHHADQAALAEQIGQDGRALLAAITADPALAWLTQVPAVEALAVIWGQQYIRSGETIRWRRDEELPPASERRCSPYEADARYSEKRGMGWAGYKGHYTETCDAARPHLITQVTTTPATTPDGAVTAPIQADLAAKDLAPETQLVDSAYTDTERVVAADTDHQIDLLGPVRPDPSWQAQANAGYAAADFHLDWERQEATCPQGKTSTTWRERTDHRGKPVIQVHFRRADCQACPVRALCTRADRRTLGLLPQPLYEARARARARQETAAFREAYRQRAGIEGTLSQGVRRSGLRVARYRGAEKVHLQQVATAGALDLVRLDAWLAGEPRAGTRQTAYARLMDQAA